MTADHPETGEIARADGAQDLHGWFGLSYAHYLTIPRSILRAMPDEWQGRMAALLRELDGTFDWTPRDGSYWCHLRDDRGRTARDRLAEYRHPDRDHIESLRVQR